MIYPAQVEISWAAVLRSIAAAFLITGGASAQTFTNGSFETGDFTGWQTAGIPSITTGPPTPVSGTKEALINSTGATASGVYANSNSATAAQLQSFLGTTLPGNAQGAATNGQAIQQTFSTPNGATLTFWYKYASRELAQNGYDETGYILNGVFHVLADTNTAGQDGSQAVGFLMYEGLPYRCVSITIPAGTTTLGFVAYNTGNTAAPSALFLDNITVAPLPASVYTPIDPPGAVYPQANGVSGSHVVGSYNANGFLYDGNTIMPLNPIGGLTQANAVSGNNVVGSSQDANGNNHGFLYDGTSFTTLDPAGSTDTVANAVSGNNVGGFYLDAQSGVHGFLYRTGTYTTVDGPNANYTEIFAVSGNISGGVYGDQNGVGHGFVYDGTNFTTVDPPGSTTTIVTGLAGNLAVGYYVDNLGDNHGFLYDGTNYTPIDPPGSINTHVSAIDGGNIVGWYQDSGNAEHGFLYDGTNYVTIDPPGSTDTQVTSISGTNLAGWYRDGSNVQHAFVADLDAGKTATTVTLDSVSTAYDGTPKSVTVTTTPPGLGIVVTYNGSTTPPTLPGDYVVIASIHDATYRGSVAGTFGIAKADAAISFGTLTFGYDGTPKPATVTATPANSSLHDSINVIVTYNGNSTPPTAAGTYDVHVVADDPLYQGDVHATLTITPAAATVTLHNLAATFDGTPQGATATTTPTGLAVTFTYDGSTTIPSAVGSYTVVGTISDPNYTGSAQDTLVISAPAGSTFGGWQQLYGLSSTTPTDTTQQDGVPLLMKYLGDIDPTQAMSASDQTALPVFGTATVNSVQYLTITYRQNQDETDLGIVLQQSSNLQTWAAVNSPPLSRQIGTDPVTGDPIMQKGVIDTGGRQFIRLQVTLP